MDTSDVPAQVEELLPGDMLSARRRCWVIGATDSDGFFVACGEHLLVVAAPSHPSWFLGHVMSIVTSGWSLVYCKDRLGWVPHRLTDHWTMYRAPTKPTEKSQAL
jgi:hypothetical protein